MPEATKAITEELAQQGIARLGRAWQILLKGHGEVKSAPNARASAQMVLIRLAHIAPMPTPAEIIQKLPSAPSAPSGPSAPATSQASPPWEETAPTQSANHQALSTSSLAVAEAETAPHTAEPEVQQESEPDHLHIKTLSDAANLLEDNGEMIIAAHIRNYVRLISLGPDHMEIFIEDAAPDDLAAKMAKHLSHYLGRPYLVSLGTDRTGKTLLEQDKDAELAKFAELAKDPIVATVLDTFEGAKITNVVPSDSHDSTALDDRDEG